MWASRKEFWDECFRLGRKHGARFPELVAAQCCLESSFGQHLSARHNYLGLKGGGTTSTTQEWYDGQWVTIKAGFIDFPSLEACIEHLVTRWYRDYRHFKGINQAPNRYAAARMLKEQSYATDPGYPAKLSRLMKEYASESSKHLPMIGPQKRPHDFGFKPGDHHIVVNDIVETAKCFSYEGKLLWELPALARGQGSDYEWKFTNTDTPPGLYKTGGVYRDFDFAGSNPPYDRTLKAYGWYSLDLVDLEGQEGRHGRAGIMLHGGGSANGWPGAWSPMQRLFATHGCIRMHNVHLRDHVMPLLDTGTIFISVYQES